MQTADLARRVLYASQLDGWQLGKSRVFLRAGQLAQLEVRAPASAQPGRAYRRFFVPAGTAARGPRVFSPHTPTETA